MIWVKAKQPLIDEGPSHRPRDKKKGLKKQGYLV